MAIIIDESDFDCDFDAIFGPDDGRTLEEILPKEFLFVGPRKPMTDEEFIAAMQESADKLRQVADEFRRKTGVGTW